MDEVRKVLAASSDWFYPILFTLLHKGMRQGEIINLEWGYVDFKEGVTRIRNKEFWKPKSSGKEIRERDIITTDELMVFLKKHKLDNSGNYEIFFVCFTVSLVRKFLLSSVRL